MNTEQVKNEVVKELTPTQRERYNTLLSIFNEDAAEKIVRNLKGRGENSWAKVYNKAVSVNKAKPPFKDYYVALDSELRGLDNLTEDAIVQTVTELRENFGIPQFMLGIKKQCLAEMHNLFICEEVSNDVETQTTSKQKEFKIVCGLLG